MAGIVEFLTARFDEEHSDAVAVRDKHAGTYARRRRMRLGDMQSRR
jgi:hypothetical protein